MRSTSEQIVQVAVVGRGTMGSAMAAQLQRSEQYVVTGIGRGDGTALLEHQDVVIVAVKPQQWSAAAEQVAEHINGQGILVWIMAGITTRRMCEDLGEEVALVRAMPTLAVDGYSLTALYAEEGALTAAQRADVEELFTQFGEYMWLDGEDQFAEFTALVGSGVGFFGEFAETFRRIAVEKRFTREQAEKMARGALRGAAHLITAEHSAAELVTSVTSAKGTTEAGLRVLRYRGFHRIMRAVIKAAARRSRELAKS